MDHIIRLYQDSFRAHGDSPAAVQCPKGRQRERFDALTRFMPMKSDFSALDFGCGLAALKPYLDTKYSNVSYTGVDIVPEFTEACRSKFPNAQFHTITRAADITDSYDTVFASGVFNLMYLPDRTANQSYIFDTLTQLFARCRVMMSIDFMTDSVDFQQDGAWHQNPQTLYDFARKTLSLRLVIDQSYMPYEFTLTVWKDQTIARPKNIYE